MQVQADKEKLLCEIDEMHAQLEKAQYNTNRFQAEKEDFQMDSERHRSTNEKLQVRICFELETISFAFLIESNKVKLEIRQPGKMLPNSN